MQSYHALCVFHIKLILFSWSYLSKLYITIFITWKLSISLIITLLRGIKSFYFQPIKMIIFLVILGNKIFENIWNCFLSFVNNFKNYLLNYKLYQQIYNTSVIKPIIGLFGIYHYHVVDAVLFSMIFLLYTDKDKLPVVEFAFC